ncbi:MAG: hypothetical protein ACRC9R_07030, partial [Enterovibrio sp.]
QASNQASPALASTSSGLQHAQAAPQAPPSTTRPSTLNVAPAAIARQTPLIVPFPATATATSSAQAAAPAVILPPVYPAPRLPPAATQQAPLLLSATSPATTTASTVKPSTTAVVSTAQGKAPAVPVFTTPAIPTTSAAAQLAPVVPPFFAQIEDEKEDEEEEQMEQEAAGAAGVQGELPLPSQESEEEFKAMLAYDSDMVGLASMDSDELYFFLERDGDERDDLEDEQARRALQERQTEQEPPA